MQSTLKLIGIAGFMGVTGCGSALPPEAAVRPTTTAVAPNRPLNLSPLKEGTWTYEVVNGHGKGTTATQVLTRDPSDPVAPWRRTNSADKVIAHLRQEPDGSIVMTANEILDRGVINTFDPPQIVLPAPDALGTPTRVTSKVTTRLRDGSKIEVDHGTAEVTLTPIGMETVQTPAGTFQTQTVELTLNLKFGFGQVQSRAVLDYADGVGLVVETYAENATAFFVPFSKSRRMVLRTYPK